ncbi:MAG: amidohydrolase [Erysipelotrichaceae bacterium]
MKTIFYNGTIITMEEELYTEAILVIDDLIANIGSVDELIKVAPDATLKDLEGTTMLPAFIDAHSHFSSYANSILQVKLENSKNFEEISIRITKFIKEANNGKGLKKGEWIVANGYDHNILIEKMQPTLALLDKIAPNNPLILQHKSGHCGVLNTVALNELKYDINSIPPKGGIIGIRDNKLTGYMEEEAYIQSIKQVPMANIETMLDAYSLAQDKYLSYGITTIQEGMMVEQMLPLYKYLIDSGILKIDLVGYSEFESMPAFIKGLPNSVNRYDKHFKLGGYKIILDGSPQVKTAWMLTPYLNSNDYGYGTTTNEQLYKMLKTAATNNIQTLVHCNGDAAIQQYITILNKIKDEGISVDKLRNVIIHAQLLNLKQLDDVADLKLIPSFFIAHILHWGDIHIKNFGNERAQYISPVNSAIKHDIIYTFHQDAPVIEPNMLETLQCAVTRTTANGVILAPSEAITILQALKGITINAAYQYNEETTKGTIKPGKYADLVILSDNPLTMNCNELENIKVLQTIKAGKTLYKQ